MESHVDEETKSRKGCNMKVLITGKYVICTFLMSDDLLEGGKFSSSLLALSDIVAMFLPRM